MDATRLQAMALATERRRVGTISRIGRALVQFDSGAYRGSAIREEPIAPGRLAVDPSIRACRDGAAGIVR
jgi:DnaK suppressor protein